MAGPRPRTQRPDRLCPLRPTDSPQPRPASAVHCRAAGKASARWGLRAEQGSQTAFPLKTSPAAGSLEEAGGGVSKVRSRNAQAPSSSPPPRPGGEQRERGRRRSGWVGPARLGSARQLWGGQAQGHAAAQGTGYLEEEEEGRGGGWGGRPRPRPPPRSRPLGPRGAAPSAGGHGGARGCRARGAGVLCGWGVSSSRLGAAAAAGPGCSALRAGSPASGARCCRAARGGDDPGGPPRQPAGFLWRGGGGETAVLEPPLVRAPPGPPPFKLLLDFTSGPVSKSLCESKSQARC